MAITTAFTTRAKRNLLRGDYQLLASGGDAVKVALFVAAATLGASTTAYSATNEASGTGYTAGGAAVTIVDPAESGTTAFIDYADVTWSTATITARGCLFYDDTESGDPALSAHDFGADKTATAGDFVLQMPAADASNAIFRLA